MNWTRELNLAVPDRVREFMALPIDHKPGTIAEKIDAHPDGKIFRSFPRAGTINAVRILVEWGDARVVFDRPDAVAALAGITPVTKTSGKQRGVSFRWA